MAAFDLTRPAVATRPGMPTWPPEGTRYADDPALRVAALVAVWAASALLVGWLSGLAVVWVGRRRRSPLLHLQRRCHWPWVLLLVTLALYNVVPGTGAVGEVIDHVLLLSVIGAAAWLVVRVLYVLEDAAMRRLRIDVVNNRRVRTQVGVLRRLTSAVVTVLALGAMLMTFTPLRALGASLLASHAVPELDAGLVARPRHRAAPPGLPGAGGGPARRVPPHRGAAAAVGPA